MSHIIRQKLTDTHRNKLTELMDTIFTKKRKYTVESYMCEPYSANYIKSVNGNPYKDIIQFSYNLLEKYNIKRKIDNNYTAVEFIRFNKGFETQEKYNKIFKYFNRSDVQNNFGKIIFMLYIIRKDKGITGNNIHFIDKNAIEGDSVADAITYQEGDIIIFNGTTPFSEDVINGFGCLDIIYVSFMYEYDFAPITDYYSC